MAEFMWITFLLALGLEISAFHMNGEYWVSTFFLICNVVCQYPVFNISLLRSKLGQNDMYWKHLIQKSFNGSNTFGTMKICSRQG